MSRKLKTLPSLVAIVQVLTQWTLLIGRDFLLTAWIDFLLTAFRGFLLTASRDFLLAAGAEFSLTAGREFWMFGLDPRTELNVNEKYLHYNQMQL